MSVREKSARASWQAKTTEPVPADWGYAARQVILPLVIVVLAFLWAAAGPSISPSNTPPEAFLFLTVIIAATALLVRQLRIRNDLDAQATLALPDPLYTLYLATVILAGAPAAIVLAVVTPLDCKRAGSDPRAATARRDTASIGGGGYDYICREPDIHGILGCSCGRLLADCTRTYSRRSSPR